MFAGAAFLLGLASCSDNNDNLALPSLQEMEESLIGLWFDEFDYAGKLEDTGEEFTSVALAMQVNKDHTGCLYAGAFNDGNYDNPIVVVDGPQLKPLTFAIDSATYVREDGKTPLGDHAPVSAKFRLLPR